MKRYQRTTRMNQKISKDTIYSHSQAILMLLRLLALDFGLQTTGYLYSSWKQTEKYYDLFGSSSFIICVLASVPANITPRQLIASAGVCIWATRLGSYLYSRVQSHSDARFDKIKSDPLKFGVAWFFQGVWVFVTALPVYFLLRNRIQPVLGLADYAGSAILTTGFLVESIADYQKSVYKKTHSDFITSGLWKYSRYPNYFGEMTFWTGMSTLCSSGLLPWQYFSLALSPLFVGLLIHNVSGVRLSERSQNEKYGHRKDFQAYVASTNMYIPWFPKKNTKNE
jgi:steroid 5-alpha reductase family enzyme